MSKSSFDKVWQPIQKKLSFPMTFHQIRHTYATNLHKIGLDPKTMQYLMGHADLDMTLGIYTDIQESQIASAAKKIEKLYAIGDSKRQSVKSQSRNAVDPQKSAV